MQMSKKFEFVRQAIADMVIDILYSPPNQLQKLYLIDTGFEGSIGDQICAALAHTNITTLFFI